MFNGLLGALPYLIFVLWLWDLSSMGTLLGLLLGKVHVVCRHVYLLNWQTPELMIRIFNFLFITTPERHWLHHQNSSVAYGDIFTFYEQPSQAWLRILRLLKRKLRKASKHVTL
jgi:hypothetical protein